MTDWKAQQMAREAAAKALQAANPKLVAVGKDYGKNDSLNAAAKNIRIELAQAFPGVKFSVKSSRFSGGDSITVSWTDGPNGDQVDAIIDRYSAGSFDGMVDLYTYERNAWTDAFGDAKYINSSRKDSDKAVESCLRTLRAKYGAAAIGDATVEQFRNGKLYEVYPFPNITNGDWSLQSMLHKELARRTWMVAKKPAAQQLAEVA